MSMIQRLLEADIEKRAIMLPKEIRLKNLLEDLLIDDGEGNRHAKFAERLKDFDINIVPIVVDKNFTAAVSFDEGVIFISEGFLSINEEELMLRQLSVLIRHELCHALLMHQIRMMSLFEQKYGKEAAEHLTVSASIHTLLNIIEDFEISNEIYSDQDKLTVKAMKRNGEDIGGLVTELDKVGRGWEDMTVEQMYYELSKEIDSINKTIMSGGAWKDPNLVSDATTVPIFEMAVSYRDVDSPTTIPGTIDKLIKSKSFQKWHEIYKDLVLKLQEKFKNNTYTEQEVDKAITDMASSSPLEGVKILGDIMVYSPEEKGLAEDVIKNLSGLPKYKRPVVQVVRATHSPEYVKGYNDVIKEFDPNADLNEITQILNGISME